MTDLVRQPGRPWAGMRGVHWLEGEAVGEGGWGLLERGEGGRKGWGRAGVQGSAEEASGTHPVPESWVAVDKAGASRRTPPGIANERKQQDLDIGDRGVW